MNNINHKKFFIKAKLEIKLNNKDCLQQANSFFLGANLIRNEMIMFLLIGNLNILFHKGKLFKRTELILNIHGIAFNVRLTLMHTYLYQKHKCTFHTREYNKYTWI